VTRAAGSRFRRADLARATEYELVASAFFRDEAGSSFRASFATEAALGAFLDMVLHFPGETSTVTMVLKAKGYTPPKTAPPEWVPSSLYFDVDRERDVAAAALLIFDANAVSHQWLSQGDLDSDDVVLVMDPYNPEFARFPPESFIVPALLREAVVEWAFGAELPPAAIQWRPATEDEVGWPVGAGY
jgi:hypothetical protein